MNSIRFWGHFCFPSDFFCLPFILHGRPGSISHRSVSRTRPPPIGASRHRGGQIAFWSATFLILVLPLSAPAQQGAASAAPTLMRARTSNVGKNARRAVCADARRGTLTDGGEEVEAVIWRRAGATFSSRCIFSPACSAVFPNASPPDISIASQRSLAGEPGSR